MLLEPGDSSHETRAASTGSSWVSLGGREGGRERRRQGWKGEKERRQERRKEGPGILVRVGTEGSLGLGRANVYIIQTKHK